MAMNMPKIAVCRATECSYNRDNKCHALAITVGTGSCPMCDTFLKAAAKGGDPSAIGGVGACKAVECRYNKNLECTAKKIDVDMHNGHPDCKTFTT